MKIGNLDISSFKVASADCKVYLGDTKVYPEEAPQTLQWVTFNNGDVIPTTLDIYGVKGIAGNLANTFYNYFNPIYFSLERNRVECSIGELDNRCYTNTLGGDDNVEFVFSDMACADYFNLVEGDEVVTATFQLYIYQ